MKKNIIGALFGAAAIMFASCAKESKLDVQFPEKFEGKTVELVNFPDSTVIQTAVITDGKASFSNIESDSLRMPLFTQLMIDGRVRAYYILEPGNAVLSDSTNVATGTPLNDKFSVLLGQLDSVENLDDMPLYEQFVEQKYNENKDNALGYYFGVEWIKYASPEKVDSLIAGASPEFRDAKRTQHYLKFAELRGKTAPGKKYTDFSGEDEKGKKVDFSSFVTPSKYTLVDFWASWCPYCIKELPELKQLYADFSDKNFTMVGVAVRDKTDDTAAAVNKHEIPWNIMYNTQRVPYDIYGFSGIPHHMLIGPDGVIVSRNESAAQLRARLEEIFSDKAE